MEGQDNFIINGLAGKRILEGQLAVKGAKNAALKVLASTFLFKNSLSVSNVPAIRDVEQMLDLLTELGVAVTLTNFGKYNLDPSGDLHSVINQDISKHLRASVVLAGPILARTGQVVFPHPGGCVIGARPIDFFLEGFKKMGAVVENGEDQYTIKAPNGKLKGAELFFKNPSVTGTETFMMAAILAEGQTVIKNAALEPEIVMLGQFLNQSGAQISGLGTSTITISGGELLDGQNGVCQIMPDRIEAGSFLLLAALAGRDLEITNIEVNHLDALIHSLILAGVKMEIKKSAIRICEPQPVFNSLDIKTHEYPGFPTDLQAPLAVFLTQAKGQSYIFETIFEGRLNYLETLNQMGAKARIIDVHRAMIDGPTPLVGREVFSPDLRAGLAYVLASIIASGQSIVHNVHYIDRGYEEIEKRLSQVGVDIERIIL